MNLADIEDKRAPQTTQLECEAANIAYHAKTVFDYFGHLCGDTTLKCLMENPNLQQPFFEVFAGKQGDGLDMGFTASAGLSVPVIVFQTGQGLTVGRRAVDNPALDPEVVGHEITHGLMWLMNSEPFDMQQQSVPFGLALVEGYANYFARALAVNRQDASTWPWARACYKYEQFETRYNLSRAGQQPGADLLAVPNLYPPDKTSDPYADDNDLKLIKALAMYDVGMVWARALWNIRTLRAGDPRLWAALADQWALNAYYYMPGWIANFEMAAEGIIDQAIKNALAPVKAIIDYFGQRNILAGRGVQALVQAGAEVLVGTDTGVKRSANNDTAWGAWEQVGTAQGEGVVALAADEGVPYAATERGVYMWDGANTWKALGTWPSQEVPLCLMVDAGVPYVGTARGVWFYNGAAWQQWEAGSAVCDLCWTWLWRKRRGGLTST